MRQSIANIDVNSLWSDYDKMRTTKTKQELVTHYLWLVRFVIKKMNLPTNALLNDQDFINIGIIGLHESIDRFELNRGIKFESYAIPRIKGIIQDELRKLDWLSRSTRKKAHDLINATDALISAEGREATQEEIMQKLDVTPEQYEKYVSAVAAAKATISMNESHNIMLDNEEVDLLENIADIDAETYLDEVVRTERTDFLTNYIQKLNKKNRMVMALYYYEDLTFKEIGKLINVSESRVCQIHTHIVKDLRDKLYEFDNA